MKIARIYAFGDSLITGTYDSRGGWCDRLKQDMHKITAEANDGTKRQMYNLGIGGETSRGLASRIGSEIAARHSIAWPAIIMIGIGKNDSRLRDGTPEVTIDEYEDNLRLIIGNAREVTDKIILIGLGPCADEEIAFKNYTYSRRRLRDYNSAMTKITKELNIAMVDVYDLLLNSSPNVHYRDKLHLNDYGYSIVYEAVKPVLMEILEKD